MDSKILRKKFLDFFKRNDHLIIPSASLVPSEEEQLAGKEKVLFTSAGMQQLIPYLMGKPHPKGKKLADVQKCLRTDDVEEVGDATHHTFFEMLGNWSLGAYWKDGAIELSFKFLIEELNIPIEKLAISVFAGDEDAPRDEESANKWKELGIPEKRIAYLGKEANWWPTNPASFGPCGPDTEMFIWVGKEDAPEKFDPEDKNWVEVWNDVFMEFNRKEDGSLEELPQKNVDTGMGLERMLAVLNGKDNDYETEFFYPLYKELEDVVNKNILDSNKNTFTEFTDVRKRRIRIFLDYSRATFFLIAEGIRPGKNFHQAVLRRLIRNATDQLTLLQNDVTHTQSVQWWEKALNHFKEVYKEVYSFSIDTLSIIKEELEEYGEDTSMNIPRIEPLVSLDRSKSEQILTNNAQKYLGTADINSFMENQSFTSLPSVSAGSVAFDAKSTLGFPIVGVPGTVSIAEAKLGENFDREEFDRTVDIFSQAHQKVSRGIEAGKFKGGLADHSETTIKYHTATHLLHQALRDVLGPQVFQKGSNITSERLRFDFSYDKKMTDEEIKKTQDLINERIKEDLKVDHMIIPLEKAKEMNAIGLFDEKYAENVSIYGVGPDFKLDPDAKDQRMRGGYYSLEFCGGPHVDTTGVIGKIKITKEEAISSGIRRIRAVLDF